MMALSTDAIMNEYANDLLRPRSTVKDLYPYVYIVAPLAADKTNSVFCFICGKCLLGKTDISAPESSRNFKLLFLSYINKRREIESISGVAAVNATG